MDTRKLINRRIVQLIAVDTNINVPIERSVIYTGEDVLTDKSDAELILDMDMLKLLPAYNEYRVRVVDRDRSETSGRDIFLEPLKIDNVQFLVRISHAWRTTNER